MKVVKKDIVIAFSKKEVEMIRKYGCGGVAECDGMECKLCPLNDMDTIQEKYEYAMKHLEESEEK